MPDVFGDLSGLVDNWCACSLFLIGIFVPVLMTSSYLFSFSSYLSSSPSSSSVFSFSFLRMDDWVPANDVTGVAYLPVGPARRAVSFEDTNPLRVLGTMLRQVFEAIMSDGKSPLLALEFDIDGLATGYCLEHCHGIKQEGACTAAPGCFWSEDNSCEVRVVCGRFDGLEANCTAVSDVCDWNANTSTCEPACSRFTTEKSCPTIDHPAPHSPACLFRGQSKLFVRVFLNSAGWR